MADLSDELQLHTVVQLHVLGVDAQHLQASSLVWHTNVDLAVKAAKAPQSSIHTAAHQPVSMRAVPGAQRLGQLEVPAAGGGPLTLLGVSAPVARWVQYCKNKFQRFIQRLPGWGHPGARCVHRPAGTRLQCPALSITEHHIAGWGLHQLRRDPDPSSSLGKTRRGFRVGVQEG